MLQIIPRFQYKIPRFSCCTPVRSPYSTRLPSSINRQKKHVNVVRDRVQHLHGGNLCLSAQLQRCDLYVNKIHDRVIYLHVFKASFCKDKPCCRVYPCKMVVVVKGFLICHWGDFCNVLGGTCVICQVIAINPVYFRREKSNEIS